MIVLAVIWKTLAWTPKETRMSILIRAAAAALLLAGCAAHHALTSPDPFAADIQGTSAPWTSLGFPSDSQFTFAVLSDRTGGMRPGVFAEAVRAMNRMRPDFVMSVGDLISGYTADTARVARQWADFDSLVGELHMPFFYCAGNHDITNLAMRKLFEQRRGKRYYHFVYKDNLFLVLDSQDPLKAHKQAAIHEEQFAYAKDVLARYPEPVWTYVFFHQPMWRTATNGAWPRLEKLLARRPHTVFAGHTHRYSKVNRHHAAYYVLSTTGGGSKLRGPHFGEMDHFLWVTATATGPALANVLLDGVLGDSLIDRDMISASDALARHRVATINGIDFSRADTDTLEIALENPTRKSLSVELIAEAHPYFPNGLNSRHRVLGAGQRDTIRALVRSSSDSAAAIISPAKLLCRTAFQRTNGPWHRQEQQLLVHLRTPRPLPCAPAAGSVVVDAHLDEWNELSFSCLDPAVIDFEPETWFGPADGSFAFDLQYDSHYVYLAVAAVDDSLVLQDADTALAKPWFQDGLEIRIDGRPDSIRSRNRGDGEGVDFLLFALCPGPAGRDAALHNPDALPADIAYACKRSADGYQIEIAIPVAYFSDRQDGQWNGFRVNIAMDDFDGRAGERREAAQLHWMPDWRSARTFDGSGMFYREKDPAIH
jgi:predicted phosphodiesterase